jgi:hypothetical protein
MRTRAGAIERALRSRPDSAAAARSDKGFAMVEASTSESPIDTMAPTTNMRSTCSRSRRTRASISPAALRTPTTPTACPSCITGAATVKTVCPSGSATDSTCVPSAKASRTSSRGMATPGALASSGESGGALGASAPATASQSALSALVMKVPSTSSASSAAPESPAVANARSRPSRSKRKACEPPRRSSPPKPAAASGPSAAATPGGSRASTTSATSSASLMRPRARWKARLSRDGVSHSIPVTRRISAIRLKTMILRASGERWSVARPLRRVRLPSDRAASDPGATQSSPRISSGARPFGAPPPCAVASSCAMSWRSARRTEFRSRTSTGWETPSGPAGISHSSL